MMADSFASGGLDGSTDQLIITESPLHNLVLVQPLYVNKRNHILFTAEFNNVPTVQVDDFDHVLEVSAG